MWGGLPLEHGCGEFCYYSDARASVWQALILDDIGQAVRAPIYLKGVPWGSSLGFIGQPSSGTQKAVNHFYMDLNGGKRAIPFVGSTQFSTMDI